MARKTKSGGWHRGASGKANAALGTHIMSLGLKSISDHKSWCREHGFPGALNKDWQERRKERALANKELDAESSTAGLNLHIEKLGLENESDYQAWCKQHRLSDSLNKGDGQRKKELDLAERLTGESVLARMKHERRRPDETIRAIYEGDIDGSHLRQPFLEKIATVFDGLTDDAARKAYLNILLHTEKSADLFGVKPAVSSLGAADGNTFLEAMGQIARRHSEWLHDVEDWKPDTHNSGRQFGSLVRHLLCQYAVPGFMDTSWFMGSDTVSVRRQDWFVHVGTGGNIRKADIPVRLTKRMAHLFLEAPDDYSVDEAFRWGQILGLEGETPLVRAVNGTLLGAGFEHEAFWGGVIHFFVNNCRSGKISVWSMQVQDDEGGRTG